MPKEAIHFKISTMISRLYEFKRHEASEFIWSSILPDMFFYVPSKRFPTLGHELHKLETKTREMIEICKKAPIEIKRTLLGIAIHLAADNIWHSQIDPASEKLASLNGKPFSSTYYHRLIESFMQRYFLNTNEELSFMNFLLKTPDFSFIEKYRQAISRICRYFGIYIDIPGSQAIKGGVYAHRYIVITLQKIKMPSTASHQYMPGQILPILSLFLPKQEEINKFTSSYNHVPEIKNIFSHKTFNMYFNRLTTLFHELLIQLL